MGKIGFQIACLAGVMGLLTPALATEQVYHPISPTFGGNPTNGTFLLSTAQAQGEGTKSGNQGPTINFPSDLTPTTPSTSNSGTTPGQTNTVTPTFRSNSLANPLGTSSGRF